MYKAESFYYLDGARYYHYFFNPASITKSFKKDRWDSCKELIRCFQQAFGDCTEYDFKNQLYLQRLYCVVNVFNQRKLISDITERKKYCKEICHDSIAQNACRFIKLAHVPIKLKILLLLIKWKQAWLIARI